MFSSLVTRASALLLAAAGLALLFAADVILPALVPGIPPTAHWLGQFLGAAWLGVAALNWLNRSVLLGGIYGRPVVSANVILDFVSALSALRDASRGTGPGAPLWLAGGVALIMALVYLWLMLRGPLERDLAMQRAATR